MNRIAFALLLGTCFFLQGCGKKLFTFKSQISEQYRVEDLDFEYFSSRTKFKYKNGNTKVRATAHMRIKKDSLIWFSLSPGVGIEVARGKITQDSMIIIDKTEKRVLRYSFESLSQEFNFEFNFELFQSVLIGDLPIKMTVEDDITPKANNFIVTQRVGDLYVDNVIDEKTRKLQSLKASSSRSQNTLSLKYSEFKDLDETAFAYKTLMVLDYLEEGKKEQATIDIEHKRVRIEQKKLTFPFIIPKSYERK